MALTWKMYREKNRTKVQGAIHHKKAQKKFQLLAHSVLAPVLQSVSLPVVSQVSAGVSRECCGYIINPPTTIWYVFVKSSLGD